MKTYLKVCKGVSESLLILSSGYLKLADSLKKKSKNYKTRVVDSYDTYIFLLQETKL